MAGTFLDITDSLKRAYPAKFIEPLVNMETPFRNWLLKSLPAGATMKEGTVYFGINTAAPQNVANILDGGLLPTAKDRTDLQGSITPKIYSGSFQIGWLTKKAYNSNAVAFNGGELKRRTEETISNTAKYMEQSFAGALKRGCRCTIQTAIATSTTFYAATNGNTPNGSILLRENHLITAYATGGTIQFDGIKVTAIDPDTHVVTIASAQTADAASLVYIAPQASAAITLANMQLANGHSLTEIVDDATVNDDFFGLSRATYAKLKSPVDSNSGTLRPISEQLLMKMVNKIRHLCGKRPTDMWSNTGQEQKYVEMIAPAVRIMQSGSGITPKATGVQEDTIVHHFPGGSMKLNVSTDIVPRSLFVLNRDTFFHYKAQSLDWWDEGSMLKPLPAAAAYYAAFYAALAAFEDWGCDYPLGNGVLRDLVDPFLGDVNP